MREIEENRSTKYIAISLCIQASNCLSKWKLLMSPQCSHPTVFFSWINIPLAILFIILLCKVFCYWHHKVKLKDTSNWEILINSKLRIWIHELLNNGVNYYVAFSITVAGVLLVFDPKMTDDQQIYHDSNKWSAEIIRLKP